MIKPFIILTPGQNGAREFHPLAMTKGSRPFLLARKTNKKEDRPRKKKKRTATFSSFGL